MAIEAVIFDMDDLMINSHPVHISIMEKVLQEQNPAISFYSGENRLMPAEESSFFGRKIPEVLDKLQHKYGLDCDVGMLNNRYN
jgi:beta-phosphoglucomutase-like phosphatase (HAD superfamily)